jgi:DNA-binding beta-propeller fold protein YncE
MTPRSAALATLLAVLWLSPGCDRGGRPPTAGTEAPPELTWPAPPDRPRIRFVRTVAGPVDLGIRPSFWERVGGILAGRDREGFVRPAGVAARDGVLYVADPGGPALWILDGRAGRSRRVVESGGHRLVSPVAVALAPGGQLFLADSALARVFRLDGAGRVVATVIERGLRRPAGLAYDAARDRLYVADSGAHQVLIFAGTGQPVGAIGRRGAAPGEFNFPTHLAVAPDGALLVTDALGYRIQRFAPDGMPAGHFGRHGNTAGDFASPKGVALDSEGHIYVVEALFDAIQVFDDKGQFLLGFGERGVGRGQLWLPGGLFIDPQDQIYVGDAYNGRVQVFQYLRGSTDDGG